MTPSDLHIGMYITNTGKNAINVYDDVDATAKPITTILPGEVIGQIVDVMNASRGYMILFISDKITDNIGILTNVFAYLISWMPGHSKAAGGIYYNDLINTIPNLDKQVQEQLSIIAIAQSHGASIMKTVKQTAKNVVHEAADVVTGVIPWTLVGVAVGGYVLLNWNKFFTPTKLRK